MRIGILKRELLYDAGEDFPRFSDGEPAAPARDVSLPIFAAAPTDADGNALAEAYPKCPDCGADAIEWRENGYVPGTRQCAECGSLYADMRYSARPETPGFGGRG